MTSLYWCKILRDVTNFDQEYACQVWSFSLYWFTIYFDISLNTLFWNDVITLDDVIVLIQNFAWRNEFRLGICMSSLKSWPLLVHNLFRYLAKYSFWMFDIRTPFNILILLLWFFFSTKEDAVNALSRSQMCGRKEGSEAAIHAMKELFKQEQSETILLVNTANTFNAVNR